MVVRFAITLCLTAYVVTAANAREPAQGTVILGSDGLYHKNSSILIGNITDGFLKNFSALDRLRRQLILKSDINRIDDAAKTAWFVPILQAESERSRYAYRVGSLAQAQHDCEAAGQEQERCSIIGRGKDVLPTNTAPVYRWRGKNQFEIEDNRKSFLREFRSTIIESIPNLPISVVDIKNIVIGNYDQAKGKLNVKISNSDPWSLDGGIALNAPLPFELPQKWTVDEKNARRIVEMTALNTVDGKRFREEIFGSSSKPIPFAALKYNITGVSATPSGAILDIEPIELSVYNAGGFEYKLGTIPLPNEINIDKLGGQSNGSSLPYLDPLLPRLLVLREKPDLINSQSYLAETFRIRREFERLIRRKSAYNGFPEVTNWPTMIRSSLLASDIAPKDSDLLAIKNWTVAASKTIGDAVLQPRICRPRKFFGEDSELCDIIRPDNGPGNRLTLSSFTNFDLYDWSYTRSSGTWVKDAVAATKLRVPEAVKIGMLPSGADIPTIYALDPSPLWYEADVPFETHGLKAAAFELRISSAKLQSDLAGNEYFLIRLEPVALRYVNQNGDKKRWEFSKSVPQNPRAETGAFELSAVHTGMPLEDAVTNLLKRTGYSEWKREEFNRKQSALSTAVGFTRPSQRSGYDERYVLYYDNNEPQKNIIAIGRDFNFNPKYSSDGHAVQKLKPQLVAKYGEPFPAYGYSNDFYWASEMITKQKMKSGVRYDDPCSLSPYRNFASGPNSSDPLADTKIIYNCGEILRVTVYSDAIRLFLIDTSRLVKEVERNNRAADAARPSPPPIKF